MRHSGTSKSDVNIDKSSDNQNQIYEANMRLSLTGSEYLEPPTTVPRLPACLETPPRVVTNAGRDGLPRSGGAQSATDSACPIRQNSYL